MSILSSVPGALSVVITLINQAYIAVVAAIWYYVVYFGLSPDYSYPLGLEHRSSFTSFYAFLFGNVYISVGALIVLAGSFLLIVNNSMGRIQVPNALIYRILFSLVLSYFSLQICVLIMGFFKSLFLEVWNIGGLNWYSLFSVTNSIGQIRMSYGQDPFFSVMEFLLLSAYFVGTGALLALLEVRQALLIFLLLTLPLFSLFTIIRGFEEYALKFWKLFVEINALPFFVLVILFNIHLFPGDFLLQIAFISLACASPYLIVTANSILSSGATRMMAPNDLFSSGVSSPVGAVRKASGLLTSEFLTKGTSGPVSADSMKEGNLRNGGWSGDDFSYRRFGGDNGENY